VPGAQQGKKITVEGCLQQAINLVQGQYNRGVAFRQDIIFHEIGQLILRPQRAFPGAVYLRHIQPQLADNKLGQIAQEQIGRGQTVAIHPLQIQVDHPGSILTSLVDPAHQEGTLAGLARGPDRCRRACLGHFPPQLGVGMTFDIKSVAQLDHPTRRFHRIHQAGIELRQRWVQVVIIADGIAILRHNPTTGRFGRNRGSGRQLTGDTGQNVLSDAFVIVRTLPDHIMQRIKKGVNRIRQQAFIGYPHGQSLRATLQTTVLIGPSDLGLHHFTAG
jgi:hypothetical protein